MKILVIGGTGFIGEKIVRQLHSQGHSLHVLARNKSLKKAREMFKDLPSINFVEGDIEKTEVLSHVDEKLDEVDCVVHLAAKYVLNVEYSEAYILNVLGTQNVLNLLRKMKNVKSFHYFSTYAVNQVISGSVNEDYLCPEDSLFFDNYAKTKNQAEHLVRSRTPSHIKLVIHRPGIVIGDKEDGPYYFFKFIADLKNLSSLTKKLTHIPLPVQEKSLMPVLPVEDLVSWSSAIIDNPPARRMSCYHLIPSKKILTKEYLEYSTELIGLKLKIICVGLTQIFPPLFRVLTLPKELVFYMKQEAHLDRSQLEKDYPGMVESDYREYLPKIMNEYLRKRA